MLRDTVNGMIAGDGCRCRETSPMVSRSQTGRAKAKRNWPTPSISPAAKSDDDAAGPARAAHRPKVPTVMPAKKGSA